MPIDLYVAPPEDARWWQATDHEGLSFAGAYPWAPTEMPPDNIRLDGYRVPFGEDVSTWRKATRDEAVSALWHYLATDPE